MKPHLCHVFPTFATGGPEVRTALLISACTDRFRHTVVSLNGDLSCRGRVHGGEAVSFVPAPRPQGRFAHLFDLVRLLRELKPDLLLTYGWGGIDAVIAARLAGLSRVVHTEDGFLPEEAQRQKPLRLLARRLALRVAAGLVCPSRTLVRVATKDWCLPQRRIRYIPNGVDGGRFIPVSSTAREAVRQRLGIDPADVVIGSVGALRPEKNQERLLRAFAASGIAPTARLLLVGDGALRGHLEERAAALGIGDRVRFTGILTDPAACYGAMDVFALSSDTEQMPLALLEAMSAGRPAAGTDVGDVRLMVSPDNRRLIVPCAREDLFAQALAELARDPGLRDRLGRANREKCLEEYGVGRMTDAYRRLYEEQLDVRR